MKLLEPAKIGNMWLRNRIVMPPMGTRMASEVGAVTEALKQHYAERAKGGAGLITVEVSWVDAPTGKYAVTHLRADEDKFIAGLTDLTDAVKAWGSKASLQIYHAGRLAGGPDIVSASDVRNLAGVVPRPLTIEEIQKVIVAFGDAALRAKKAGFDAVEIHGGHGYLINQFLSPFTNKRTDQYGGSTENRARFALEVIRAVRQKVGPSFPIIFRMSADEFVKGGLVLEESRVIAQMLEKEGVDALSVSGAIFESFSWMIQPAARPEGCLVHLAEGIKQVVKVPIITVGSIMTPQLAEQILQENKADLIAMGRALFADPELPNKVMQGRVDEIRPCIRCNRCIERSISGRRMRCTVNAAAGRDAEFRIIPTLRPKKVLVVGGGPAGIEAARVAAARGHKVSLYEKGSKLGGQLIPGTRPPHKEALQKFVNYLEGQLRRLGVEIRLNNEVTAQSITRLKPDAVVIATGGIPCPPRFPIADGANVVEAQEVLTGAKTGKNVIIIGGGTVGVETAEFLAKEGKQVTVTEMLPDIAMDMEALTKSLLLVRLQEYGVKLLTNAMVQKVTAKGVIIGEKGGERELPADTVVLAIGVMPRRELFDALNGKVAELYSIGDCMSPRNILNAVHEGALIGTQL